MVRSRVLCTLCHDSVSIDGSDDFAMPLCGHMNHLACLERWRETQLSKAIKRPSCAHCGFKFSAKGDKSPFIRVFFTEDLCSAPSSSSPPRPAPPQDTRRMIGVSSIVQRSTASSSSGIAPGGAREKAQARDRAMADSNPSTTAAKLDAAGLDTDDDDIESEDDVEKEPARKPEQAPLAANGMTRPTLQSNGDERSRRKLIADLQMGALVARQQRDALQLTLDNTRAELAQLNGEHEADLSELNAEIERLTRSAKELWDKNEAKKDMLRARRDQVFHLEAQLEELRKIVGAQGGEGGGGGGGGQAAIEVAEMREKLERAEQEARNANEEARDAREAAIRAAEASERDNVELANSLSAVKATLESKARECDVAQAEVAKFKNAETKSARERMEALLKEVHSLERKLADAQREGREAQKRLEAKVAKAASAMSEAQTQAKSAAKNEKDERARAAQLEVQLKRLTRSVRALVLHLFVHGWLTGPTQMAEKDSELASLRTEVTQTPAYFSMTSGSSRRPVRSAPAPQEASTAAKRRHDSRDDSDSDLDITDMPSGVTGTGSSRLFAPGNRDTSGVRGISTADKYLSGLFAGERSGGAVATGPRRGVKAVKKR